MLWDLNEGKHLYTLEAGEPIEALAFSPNRYWLSAAFGSTVRIWDLESKTTVDDLRADNVAARALSLAWSADGGTLFAGYTDNTIRVWQVAV